MKALRVIAMLLVLAVAASAAGCGDDEDADPAAADATSAAAEPTTAAAATTADATSDAAATEPAPSSAATAAEASTDAAPATDGEPVTIGGAVALTGFFNAYDLPQNAMMEFAIEDFAAEGGRPYEIVYANTNSEIDKGANAALEVLDKGADVVVTSPDYDFGRAAALEGVKAGKLVVGAAGSAKFGKQGIGETAFNVGIATNSEGAVMAEYANKKLGFKNAYVLLDDTIEYTKKTCEHFEQRWGEVGGELAGSDIFKNADPSIASQITRLKGASDADVVILCSYNPGAASAIRQLRAAGVDLPIFASASMDGAYWLEATPDLADFYYVAYASLFGDDPDPKVNELVQRYRDKTGEEPTQSTSLAGYAQMQVIREAVEKTGSTDGAELAAYLETLTDFPTVLGPLTYTPDAHFTVDRPLRVMRIEAGKQSFVELWDPEQVPPMEL